jgi:hypothetical protein
MENISNIFNDNERFKKPSSNNDNVEKIEPEYAEGLADYIKYKLNAQEGSRKYFLKVAYKLPRGFIDRTLATALETGKSPVKLFVFLTKKEMDRRYGKNS